MIRRYIIFAPSYLETSGGIVVLHKLCSILNDLGFDSYLYPYFETYELNKNNIFNVFYTFSKNRIKSFLNKYKQNTSFNTKIYFENPNTITNNDIVIYPEIVFGNPLNAKNIVRWLLHQPGFHNGKIYYGKNELYFKFNSAINDFQYLNSKTSNYFLKVIHYPTEYYNCDNIPNERKGIAYCIRKGKGKKIQHDLKNSILIDGKKNSVGLSHRETAQIFKKVDTFISYDTYTAYSIFAVLCGCKSIVIPDDNVQKEEWYPDKKDRYGIAYGFDESELKHAKETAHLVLEHIKNEELKNIDNVKLFLKEVNEFFQ